MNPVDPKMFYRALLDPFKYCSTPNINTFPQGPRWYEWFWRGRIAEHQRWMVESIGYADDTWAEHVKQNWWRNTSSGGWSLDMDFLAAVKPYVKNV
jgi:hypothetical protein